MKKLLLLFFALLTGVSGVRAASPNILAYPEAGKIYYMSAYYSGSEPATQAYIYYNGTQFDITTTAPSSGDFGYLWLCSKDGDNYRFQNLKSGKYLGHKGESKDSPFNFNLGKTVTNATCVTLYSISNSKYNVIKHSASTFDQADDNYHNSNFSSDFLLEEYAAKTLSHNQYYYIYCDNDDSATSGTDRPQYIYNNNGNFYIQTDATQVSLTNYAWRAQQLSAGHFSFKNGTKYMSFHTLADAAYDWQTDKEDAYGTGRVMLWGIAKARYMLQKWDVTGEPNTGGVSQTKYYPKSGEWSQDYMFVVAPQTNVFRVAIKTDDVSKYNPVFTYDGINYSGDCSIYVDKNNMPGTKTITLSSSDGDYIFVGFYKEDGTSLGTSVDVSELAADMGVKAVFIPYKSSSSYATATWYYWTVNGKYVSLNESAAQLNDSKKQSKDAAWAFVRTGTVGKYQIVNASLTSSYYLNFAGVPATMVTSGSYTNCMFDVYSENIYITQDGYYVKETSSGLGVNATGRSSAVSTLEAVDWSELALAEIKPYESILDHYFGGVTTTSYNTVKSIAGNVASFSDYNTFISGYSGYLSVKNAPNTGYYRIKNKLTTGEYGYIGVSGTSADEYIYLKGNISNVNDASTIIRITKDGTGKYNFQTQGKYIRNVRKDEKSYLIDDAPSENFAMTAQSPGYCVIKTWSDGPYSHLHAASGNSYYIVGWENAADASQWVIEDAETVSIPLHEVDSKYYGTMYLPFDVTLPTPAQGNAVFACRVSISGNRAQLTSLENRNIPAGTPVLLYGEGCGTSIDVTITSGASAIEGDNALEGTYFDKTSLDDDEYIFGTRSGELGFWKLGTGYKVGANKAYLVYNGDPSEVKGFTLDFDEIETGIQEVNGEGLRVKNEMIFNLAGQRVSKAQKGLYIIGGKKILVK